VESTALPEKNRSVFITVLCFAIVYIGWGSTYLAIRVAVQSVPPFVIGALRFLFAGSLVYLWCRWRGIARPNLEQWRHAFVVGILLFLVGNGSVIWAEQRIHSGTAALLVATVPLFVTLFTILETRVRPSFVAVAGIAGGLVGVAVLVRPGTGADGTAPLREALTVLCGSCGWAFGSLYARKVTLSKSPLMAVGMEMLAGGIAMFAAALLSGQWGNFEWSTGTTDSYLAILYLAVIGSMVAFTAYMWLFKNVSPAQASTYAYVNPIVAVALGYWLLGEDIGTHTIVAALVITFSVAAILTPARPPREVAIAKKSLPKGLRT